MKRSKQQEKKYQELLKKRALEDSQIWNTSTDQIDIVEQEAGSDFLNDLSQDLN